MDLNKEYYKYTGIKCDVESLISECVSDEEKVNLYQKLLWHLKRGQITMNKDSKITQDFANLMNTISEKLSISLSDDMDNDGDIDDTDKKLFDDLNNVKDILSSLDITTQAPDEDPTKEPEVEPTVPTEPEVEPADPEVEPTEDPTEEPEVEPTEDPTKEPEVEE